MMMTERQLIERFLELQEHPEQMTDEQIRQVLADSQMHELVEQMAFVKRALGNQQMTEEPQVDEEWERFAARHISNDTSAAKTCSPVASFFFQFRKKVAIFVGILLVSSIAFAAIQIVRHHAGGDLKSVGGDMEPPIQEIHQQVVPEDTAKTDTINVPEAPEITQPIVFDNVRLDEILPQIASYYHMEVEFNNEHVRQLRFYFIWKREDGLDHVIEKLNRFESVSIKIEVNKIIVE